ncbi:MAG: AMP-dependent synthetase/ligase [Pyrinomonadaceae bacterium]|nr:AMP-dependent synthetase/ligase [Pyrinomonadaceae bacterium]MCX7640023.1 AMP-dependent synthetase/ligase [Pyrinomonadaceae bacterium]MDW8304195.1 AMP-dependent synthetase/ligase [Acidobacteriota bacterium]
MSLAGNIYSLFRTQTAKYSEEAVFYRRKDNYWKEQTWAEFEEQVHSFACALLACGLTKGTSLAILAGNIPEWTIVDIATIAAGGVGVGIYPTSSREQVEYIVNHSDAQFAFVDSAEQFEKLISANCPKLKRIVTLERIESSKAVFFEDFLSFGRSYLKELLSEVERIGYEAKPEDIAIMVYTSGTTGKPKGAMLSHRYVLNSVESLRLSVPIFHNDVTLSYLPACHVAERISGIYNRLYNGTAAYFVDDVSKLYEYMLEIKPTVFASLPRFFEKIYARIISEHGVKPDPKTVRDAFGGRIRLLTSGGAPLPLEVAEFFASAGLPILQAYGLTENVCVAFNTFESYKIGTVGKPMPMCQVKIAPDGEILVKSEMMFSGYYKDPHKTKEMFDEEGWLKTGDIGEIDEDGFLKVTGRKKEIIVLSTGKKVAPLFIESAVKENHLVSQCFLYGDGRSYCVALVTLNENEAKLFAGSKNTNLDELTKNEGILNSIRRTIEQVNSRVSSSEQIKKFLILPRDFSIDLGEITPTMKLRREVIAENFKREIEKLYESS